MLQKSAAAAKSLQSCPTLCDPRDGSPPGSSVPGILQARTLERVVISLSNAWEWKVKVKLLSRARLRDPMDCSPPGSSIHGIFQARILEWGAIAFSVTKIYQSRCQDINIFFYVIRLMDKIICINRWGKNNKIPELILKKNICGVGIERNIFKW